MDKPNKYDLQAIHAALDYRKQHSNFPQCIEATAEYRSKMTCTCLEQTEGPNHTSGITLGDRPHPASVIQKRIPIVAVGTRDIVFHRLLVRNADISLEQAKCSTAEQFQRMGAKFARAGCLLLEPKQHWGQQNVPPFLFYSQIEVYAFGEQSAFDKTTVAEEPNQLPGD